MGVPYNYDFINKYNSSVSPSTVHCSNTQLVNYYKRYLLQKAISVFEWTLPEGWSEPYFLYTLFCTGFVGVLNTDKFGVIPQYCGLYGYDVFYQPTHITVANPLLRMVERPKIDYNCTLIKLQPDYGNIMDIVGYYADMLALCAEAAGVNIINSKIATVFFANNKTVAETYKKLYDTIMAGNPMAVVDKTLKDGEKGSAGWEMFNRDVKQSYILTDIISDMRKIENQFDTLVGIPNSNTDKRERLITAEVESNAQEVESLCKLWLETIRDGVVKTNAMFDTGISVRLRFREEVDENGPVVNTVDV